MFIHNINPVLLELGPFQIRYYGLFYVTAFLIAYFMIPYLAKFKGLKLNRDDVGDFLVYALVGVVGGARLFHVLGNLGYYAVNPVDIIAVWKGGLAFHGGLMGAIAAAYYFCKKKNVNFWDFADIVAVPVSLGLFFGRLGNFFNAELVGRIWNGPWSVNFNNEVSNGNLVFRHPSQIYEALKNLAIFFVLFPLSKKGLPRGFIFWLFIFMYGLLRTSIEFVRQPWHDTLFFGFLSGGQLLTIPMIAVGSYMLYNITNKK